MFHRLMRYFEKVSIVLFSLVHVAITIALGQQRRGLQVNLIFLEEVRFTAYIASIIESRNDLLPSTICSLRMHKQSNVVKLAGKTGARLPPHHFCQLSKATTF